MLGMSEIISVTIYVDNIIILIGIFDQSSHHKTYDHI